jgi:acyl-CoA reductase-like NAD-dependent aldehyde dehydrogenase
MASSASSSSPPPFPRIAISQLEGRAQPIHYRKTQLHRLQIELLNSADEIKASIKADEGHTSHEADFEYILVLSELRQHYDTLNPKNELATMRQIELGNSNLSRSKSTSIAYVEPSAHTRLYSVLSPVCAAIAAGNCVIVEVSGCLTVLQPEYHRREHLLKDNSFRKL